MMLKAANECPIKYLNYLKVETRLMGTESLVEVLCSVLRVSLCRKTLYIELESKSCIELEVHIYSYISFLPTYVQYSLLLSRREVGFAAN